MNWTKALTKLKACEEAVEWAETQPDFSTAWQNCERADWMLWLAGAMAGKRGWPERKAVILARIACGRLSLEYAGKYRAQLTEVFDIAERCANDPTPENIAAARSAARSAESAAESRAAWSAARSAESAAESRAEFRTPCSAARSATRSAWSAEHKTMCAIIREHIKPGELERKP